jgi:hypothetical protein
MSEAVHCLSFPISQDSSFSSSASGRLPLLECEYCQSITSVGFGYPLVKVADLKEYFVPDDGGAPSVSLSEFKKIQDLGRTLYGADTLLMPGPQVGEFDIYPAGRPPKHLFEIERISRGGLLFSMRLINALSCYDIFPQHVQHELRQADGKVRFFGLIQVPVYRILDPSTFNDTGCQQCVHCGCINSLHPQAVVPPKLYFDSKMKDSVAPIFRVIGYEDDLFVCDEVVRTFQAIDNLGAELQPWGQWV